MTQENALSVLAGDEGPGACCDAAFVDQLKALAHPVRMQIVRQLLKGGQSCCGDICSCMPLAQSTVSQHLDLLRKAGLVHLAPEGTRSLYSLDQAAFTNVARQMAQLAAAAGDGAGTAALGGKAH